jgi:hypothetical protein
MAPPDRWFSTVQLANQDLSQANTGFLVLLRLWSCPKVSRMTKRETGGK